MNEAGVRDKRAEDGGGPQGQRMPPVLARLMDRAWEYYGIARSLRMYYPDPFHLRRMQRFYAQFIRPGDLCFDIGAHVGSRIGAWLRIGAQVVAVEPQPACVRLLRRWYGGKTNVTLVASAVGATPGDGVMLVSRRSPTVSTLSPAWVSRVTRLPSFAVHRWDGAVPVTVTTLDELIARYGEPAFCKIDVEGYEPEVLRGLSRPLRCLSYEYIPVAVESALACLDRLSGLGAYEFNASPAETMRFVFPQWVEGAHMAAWLKGLSPDERAGDVYARLRPGQLDGVRG